MSKLQRRYVRAAKNPLALALDGTPAQRDAYVRMRAMEPDGKRQFGEDARLWLLPQRELQEAYRDLQGLATIQEIARELEALHVLQRAIDSADLTNV